MALDLTEDRGLVAAAQSGDDAAFSALVQHNYRRIYRVTVRITGNAEDAEDSLQEAFTKAYFNLARFQGQSCFATWITRIAMNEALMRLRKRHPGRWVPLDHVEPANVSPDSGSSGDDPERRFARTELMQVVSEAVGALSPPLRTTFILREVDELSVRETAAVQGISVTAAKSRLKRARDRLRYRLRQLRREGWPR